MNDRTLVGDDYELISKELLVTKDVKQLRNRSKNQRNNRTKTNVIRRYYSLYTDFIKWDKQMYTTMCNIITNHGTLSILVRCSDELAGDAAHSLLLL